MYQIILKNSANTYFHYKQFFFSTSEEADAFKAAIENKYMGVYAEKFDVEPSDVETALDIVKDMFDIDGQFVISI